MSDLIVTCDDCGKSGKKALPAVDLLGSTVVYTDEDDPESQYLVHGDDAVCYHCVKDEGR